MQITGFCNKERRAQGWVAWLIIILSFAFYVSLKSHQNPWQRKFPKICLSQSPLILLSPFICAGMGWKLHWFHQSDVVMKKDVHHRAAGLMNFWKPKLKASSTYNTQLITRFCLREFFAPPYKHNPIMAEHSIASNLHTIILHVKSYSLCSEGGD